eukprot:TRINITY_DN1995_c1_g1::TRINITY_DN1995_c1_g1_i1::g.22952::m.22952 TRINITY_DN1995_c1_g1::TRINITY_DN1995_c1_g1_i1::g.22952  ORF type:complete len:149 (+),score=11.26 TRINITY_DN1995_c1_g1_i1:57-449(+)
MERNMNVGWIETPEDRMIYSVAWQLGAPEEIRRTKEGCMWVIDANPLPFGLTFYDFPEVVALTSAAVTATMFVMHVAITVMAAEQVDPLKQAADSTFYLAGTGVACGYLALWTVSLQSDLQSLAGRGTAI